jgi:hypothetical protein
VAFGIFLLLPVFDRLIRMVGHCILALVVNIDMYISTTVFSGIIKLVVVKIQNIDGFVVQSCMRKSFIFTYMTIYMEQRLIILTKRRRLLGRREIKKAVGVLANC